MTMHTTQLEGQAPVERLSKKEIAHKIYINIATSLSEFNLSGKKFDAKVKKVSKLFAKDIKGKGKKKKG